MRVGLGPDGSLVVGRTLAGRGAWLCGHTDACLVAAAKRSAFGRALRAPISDEAVAALRDGFPTADAPARD